MPGVNYFPGSDFRKAPIVNNRIQLRAHSEHEYQQLIEQTKVGIAATNRSYENYVRSESQQRVAEERRRIQETADAEKRRQQLKSRLSL